MGGRYSRWGTRKTSTSIAAVSGTFPFRPCPPSSPPSRRTGPVRAGKRFGEVNSEWTSPSRRQDERGEAGTEGTGRGPGGAAEGAPRPRREDPGWGPGGGMDDGG